MGKLILNQKLAENYTSNSQKIRVMSEAWTKNEIICPACGEALENSPNNSKVLDFNCASCDEEYELKSKSGGFYAKVTDGGYASMMHRLTSSNSPHFFFMSYNLAKYEVNNFFVVPSYFLRPASIEKRKPLSTTARRAGWVGCNILLDQIPESGKIDYVKNGQFISPDTVRRHWKRTAFLAENKSLESRGWTVDILDCIERIGQPNFTLGHMYQFETELTYRHPNNNFIKDKIRQQLQILRDKGLVDFVGRGKYHLVKI